MNYKCLVADDEPIARSLLVNYIGRSPLLSVEVESINAFDAMDCLKSQENQIDIIFLDINMPGLSGLQLIKALKPIQPVILTTAYAEFAAESYDLHVADYLLKPFSFERFSKAAEKAIVSLKSAGTASQGPTRSIFIKSDGKNYPVCPDDILYCEALKNYTLVVMKNDRRLMPLLSLSKLETLLACVCNDFIRIHRSFIISKKHVAAVSANRVIVNKFAVPIGVHFKARFLEAIGIKEGK